MTEGSTELSVSVAETVNSVQVSKVVFNEDEDIVSVISDTEDIASQRRLGICLKLWWRKNTLHG